MRTTAALLAFIALLGLHSVAFAQNVGEQVTLNLSALTNYLMPTTSVPTGTVVWSGTTYRLDSRVFHSRDAVLGWYPDELSVSVPSDARNAAAVQILINLDGAPGSFQGLKVGEVVLRWGNGAQQTVDLIAGVNVRGWLVADSSGQLTDAGSSEAFRDYDVYGRPAVIDRLTVLADPSVADSGLTRVTIRDTSFETAGALDPSLVVRAITVETLETEDEEED